MALNKNTLGLALYTRRESFCNKTLEELIEEHGSMANVRLNASIADADEIIKHLIASGVINVTVNTTGTAFAHTGTGVGTIS